MRDFLYKIKSSKLDFAHLKRKIRDSDSNYFSSHIYMFTFVPPFRCIIKVINSVLAAVPRFHFLKKLITINIPMFLHIEKDASHPKNFSLNLKNGIVDLFPSF